MGATLIAFGLALVIAGISYFLYLGLRNPGEVSWPNITIGACLFLLCCAWVVSATIHDWGIVALIQILFGVVASFVSGVSLALALKRWRKITGLIVAIGIPLALYASLEAAFPYSPDQVIRRNGEAIVAKALNEYYADNQTYPHSLNELVPSYISDLREPKSIWGWLYIGNSSDYTLGYVSDVDRMGYAICRYSASSPKWECLLDYSTVPFSLEPTPMQ